MANAAICAMHFLDQMGKDATGAAIILNLDYHYSQGTADVLRRSSRRDLADRIFCVSIHADPLIDYPSFVGFENENENEERMVNITFSAGIDFAQYRPLLNRALMVISAKVKEWKAQRRQKKTSSTTEMLLVIELGKKVTAAVAVVNFLQSLSLNL